MVDAENNKRITCLAALKTEISNMEKISEAVCNTATAGQDARMHNGIIEYLAHGSDGENSFLLIEKAECDLEKISLVKQIEAREFIDWIVNVCGGLQFLHATVKLVHFDLKPANLHVVIHMLRVNTNYEF